ncbi:MAG: class I SAM-dependent methyltransferase [Anaerolineales bacterium]|nr:class I SAM-dependent methyltransferase [Anaerolineales bacterium]
MKSRIKALVWAIFRLIQIDAFFRKPDYHYVPDYFGKSAHKQMDIRTLPIFGELAGQVIRDGRCSLYYDRLFTIHQILVHLNSFRKTGEEIHLAEVGVYKGGTSYFIASLAERLDLKIRHHCFDTFEGHAATDINTTVEISHMAGAFSDTSFESVKEYLMKFENIHIYKGRFQDTSHHVQDVHMNFVHLDMDIYEPTVFALNFFDDKLAHGGVILLDDYGFDTCPGIPKAVKEFTETHPGYFGMSLLTGQYLLIKH